MERWSISYKAKTEHFNENIVWNVRPYGELVDILNSLLKEEKIIEIVSINRIEQ